MTCSSVGVPVPPVVQANDTQLAAGIVGSLDGVVVVPFVSAIMDEPCMAVVDPRVANADHSRSK